MHIDLVSLLMEHGCSDTKSIKKTVISECVLSILQIRDRLYMLGNIIYEDLDRQVYVAKVRAGYGNMNSAVVAMQLQGEKLFVAGYAKEGVIRQNICEQAFQKLTDAAHGREIAISSKPKWIFPSILGLVIVVTIVAMCRNSYAAALEIPRTSPTSGAVKVRGRS